MELVALAVARTTHMAVQHTWAVLAMLLLATTTPTAHSVRVSTQWALLEAFTSPEVHEVVLAANINLINSAIWPPSGLPVTSHKSLVRVPLTPCILYANSHQARDPGSGPHLADAALRPGRSTCRHCAIA
jgi:hypothetical protein